ncbi:toluene hydroxylase [Bacillus benzoevorans]|uniref:propane 2-monooxygenase n=1 Tax=Bacillus benzoevorans TaxID=1456 RepID=A0A7X0HTP7_9BACI|nr:toluene hydroxylase [Bacillus benzoevorans]MBB6446643.1 phenol hydroxylase P1 protein [Bacillus benzoevorans]
MTKEETGFKKTIRDQPWDFKTKNEYEEVTLRMQPYVHMHYRHKYDGKDFDIYDPRYTKLKSSDWEAFRDPKKFWYTTYVNNRKKMAEETENAFNYAKELGVIENLSPLWVDALRELYTPLRHLEYGESVQMQYVIRYSLGTAIEQCATYQAFDKIGRAQWITQWAINMEEHHGDFLKAGKEVLLTEPAFQLLRGYVEDVLVTDDWAEVLVATNLTLDLLLGNLMYREFNKEAVKQGDTHLSLLNLVIGKQLDWSRDWAVSLLGMLAKDEAESRWDYLKAMGYEDWEGDYRWGRIMSDPRETPEETQTNLEIIQEWVEKWYPKAYEAVLALAPLFEKNGVEINLQETLKKIEEEHIVPVYKKHKLPLKQYEIAIN